MEGVGASVTAFVGIVKSVLGLFSEFPMNIILGASLGGLAFGWIKKGKRAAG